jgi:putative DNA-invertase from lambdoid prophage Rac
MPVYNQLQEIAAAGFQVEPRRVVAETISGSIAISQRPGFTRLVDRLEAGDVLVVTKLDRLGRNAMDVGSTVARLADLGVRVHCLALGGVDLTSSSGKLTMSVINAVAEFERDLLIERTQAGLSRARAEGKAIGRPASITGEDRQTAEKLLADGTSVSAIARHLTSPCLPSTGPSKGCLEPRLLPNRSSLWPGTRRLPNRQTRTASTGPHPRTVPTHWLMWPFLREQHCLVQVTPLD